jgi:hypothetical protein
MSTLNAAGDGEFAGGSELDGEGRNVGSGCVTSSKQYISSSHKHRIENLNDDEASSDGAGSDEDVLHVVTNVYTIPIIKSTSAGNGPFVHHSQHEMNTASSVDESLGCKSTSNILTSTSIPTHVVLGEPRLEMHSKTSSHETRRIDKRVIESTQKRTCQRINGGEHVTSIMRQLSPSQSNSQQQTPDVTKSKFQIRSIVEIYENPVDVEKHHQQEQKDTGIFKTSTHFEETTTKQVFNDTIAKGN